MAAPYYYWLCKFTLNISTNISTSGQRTLRKLGELASLFTFFNITTP